MGGAGDYTFMEVYEYLISTKKLPKSRIFLHIIMFLSYKKRIKSSSRLNA